MNRKRWLYLVAGLLITLSLLVPGCAKEPEVGTIKVGLAFSTSGFAAKVGREVRDGVLLAIKLFNDKGGVSVGGKQYHIMPIEYTTGTSAEEGLSVTKRLIEDDKVVVLFGDCISTICLVQQPVIEKAKIPWMMFGVHPGLIKEGNRYTFRIGTDSASANTALLEWYRDNRGFTKWSVLAANDAMNKSNYDLIIRISEEIGIEVVTADVFESGSMDFYPVLTKIKAKNPEAVFVSAVSEAATILRQAHEIGFEPEQWVVTSQISSYELVNMVGDIAAGVEQANSFDAGMDKPEIVEFVSELEEFLGRGRAVTTTALGYDGGMRMFQAIEHANSLDAEAIIAALQEVEWTGTLSSGAFDELGRITFSYYVMRVKADGSLEVVARVQ